MSDLKLTAFQTQEDRHGADSVIQYNEPNYSFNVSSEILRKQYKMEFWSSLVSVWNSVQFKY